MLPRTRIPAPLLVPIVVLALAIAVSGCGGGGGGGGGGVVAVVPLSAVDDTALTFRGQPVAIAVLDNDSGAFRRVESEVPANGRVEVIGETVRYTPRPGFVGVETFLYSVTDSTNTTVTAQIEVTVLQNLADLELEPNDDLLDAGILDLGLAGEGELSPTDTIDVWSFFAFAGEVLEVELLGGRRFQEFWDADCLLPKLRILDEDGVLLREHVFATWDWGSHDLDFPAVAVRTSGTIYLEITAVDAIGQVGGVASGGLPYTVAVGLAPVGPLQEEIEPRGFTGQNEFIEDAEPITAGFLRGHHVEGEFDLYSFTLEEPSWVTIEVSAFRNGAEEGEDSAFDPALLIYDSVGDFLFYNEDAFYYDPAISFLFSLPGTYYIEVTSFFGDRSSDYTLTLDAGPLGDGFESLSNDTPATADSLAYGEVIRGVYEGDPDLFAFEGSAGDMVRAWFYNSENHFLFDAPLTLTWLDVDGVTPLPFAPADAGEGGLNVARALLPADGTYYLAVDAPLGTATSVYGLRLEAVRDAAAVEVEPNDLTTEATPIPASGRVFGSIDATLDEDTYSFTAVAGEPVRIAVFADRSAFSDGFFFWSGHGSTLAPAIEIHDGTLAYSAASWAPLNGCVGAEGVSEGLATIEASFIAPSTGTYYVTIFSPFTLTVDDRPFYLLERR